MLLVHGREDYRRNCYMINYTFYKNIVFVFPTLVYGFYSGWSATTYYELYLTQIYNVVFTVWPVIIYALFDQEHSKGKLRKDPSLYRRG